MATWKETHPWLSFEFDTSRLNAEAWLLLGEAKSKCEHIAGVPLSPDVARELHQIYLAKGVQATTAIEGNTLSEDEVRDHMRSQLDLPFSKRYLQQEIENILEACNAIYSGDDDEVVSPETLRRYNALVLRGLELKEGVVAGEVRKMSVGVGTYRAPPWQDCGDLLALFCDWLERSATGVPEQQEPYIAILRAVLAHLYFVWIHPFGDGNGRTARLLEHRILMRAGVPSPASHLLSNYYNQTRTRYYRELDRASATGDPSGFVVYAVRGLVEQLKEQLTRVQRQQLDVAWEGYVHQQFKNRNTVADVRRRKLVFALSDHGQPVLASKVALLNTTLAAGYAGKTTKTVSRDLNALVKMGLVQRVGRRFRARTEIILAFVPRSMAGSPPRVPGA